MPPPPAQARRKCSQPHSPQTHHPRPQTPHPQATRKGWPYYIRPHPIPRAIVRSHSERTGSYIVGPPLAGGLRRVGLRTWVVCLRTWVVCLRARVGGLRTWVVCLRTRVVYLRTWVAGLRTRVVAWGRIFPFCSAAWM